MTAPAFFRNKDFFLFLCQGKFVSRPRCLTSLASGFNTEKRIHFQRISSQQNVSFSSDVHKTINIPDKIKRSPTAILEALAKTVRNDINKPMYQSIDDPALLGKSPNLVRHNFAAMDNGIRAAQEMIKQTPDYYTSLWDVPVPQTYDTVFMGYKHKGPSENALLERIQLRKVIDSIQAYKALKAQGMEISQATLESLLDLLTVYNHPDEKELSGLDQFVGAQEETNSKNINGDFVDLKAYADFSREGGGDVAQEVFDSLPIKTSRAFCSMICWAVEYKDKERAMELYREAKAKKVPLDVFTFNKLLQVQGSYQTDADELIKEIKYLLRDMASMQLTPNVGTFNSAMKSIRSKSYFTSSKQFVFSLLSEMKACGIQPSLGTWNVFISIFYQFKKTQNNLSPVSPDLFERMLDEMKNVRYDLQDKDDTFFFRSAMLLIERRLPDSKLALKLHQILTNQQNYYLLGKREAKYGYFAVLFELICPVEHTDDVMAIYTSVCPYIYFPTPRIFEAILHNIETFDAYHYIPQIAADLEGTNILFEPNKGSKWLYPVMAKEKQEPQLQQQFCDITTANLESWKKNKLNRGPKPYIDGEIIGNMITIYLNGGKLKEAQNTLRLLQKHRVLQVNDPSDKSLMDLAEAVMATNDYKATKDLLNFMYNFGCDISPLATQALDKFQLSEQERNYWKALAHNSKTEEDSSDTSDSD